MQMRHERKHIIGFQDFVLLNSRLSNLLAPDTHANAHGEYRVRSLYFDDFFDTALKDKINGVNRREKFRIRYYDNNLHFMRLEKKTKINGMCSKKSAEISKEQTQSILQQDYDFLLQQEHPLFKEFYSKIRGKLLQPKVIVEYLRKPFTYPAGNVRITLDYNIKTSLTSLDFLSTDPHYIPACEEYAVLEVKYDAFIPDFIKKIIHIDQRSTSAFSKYAIARRFD